MTDPLPTDYRIPMRRQRLTCVNWPLLVALAALVLWLAGCGDARGTHSGPEQHIVATGPVIDVDSPRFVVQKNGQGMSDGHGGTLEYHDPVVAGVILERLAVADPRSLYTIDQRGGRWGVRYDDNDSYGDTLAAHDISVQQENSSGLAAEAALTSGPALFQVDTRVAAGGRSVEWYLDGALVGEGDSVTIDLTPGQHLLGVIVFDSENGTQVVDIPLYVEAALARATLQWSVPEARENGEPLSVEELCCYQVTFITGNELGLVDVPGGATSNVLLELPSGYYRFSIVAIDTEGLISEPSASVEADLI